MCHVRSGSVSKLSARLAQLPAGILWTPFWKSPFILPFLPSSLPPFLNSYLSSFLEKAIPRILGQEFSKATHSGLQRLLDTEA